MFLLQRGVCRDSPASLPLFNRLEETKEIAMNLRVYEPAKLLNQLHHEMNRLFEPQSSWLPEVSGVDANWAPPVDIKEDESHYLIRADVPGVDPKDIEVTLERGVLTIAGSRGRETKEERQGYRRVERFRGSFTRAFALPDTADADKVDAKVKDGVLEIVINKKESSKPRRIAVQS
jgi:HSP20 family protein